MSQETQTLNIPSLLAFTALTILAIRYFFFSPPSSSNSANPSSSSQPRATRSRVPPSAIDTVASMFPQFTRRDIEWDLSRNGSSTQATTDRILREGRLPGAPENFRARTPPSATTTTTTTGLAMGNGGGAGGGSGSSRRGEKMPTYENLIQRYKLDGKVGATGEVNVGGVEDGGALQTSEKQAAKGGWSSNKSQRAETLKNRREEMILAARRKMELREKKEGKAKAT